MLNLDPIWLPGVQQIHFRQLLDAMARPGKCHPLASVPGDGPVVLSLLATLLDAEVTLADPYNLLRPGDWSMLQVKSGSAEKADYVLCDARQLPDFLPKLGTLPCPDQSATLILIVSQLGQGVMSLKLSGPGIADTVKLQIKGLDQQWLNSREDWVSAFPLGVDLILIDDKQVAALPRTTRVEVL